MATYICRDCSYVYDEAKEAQTFGELPEGWVCPVCGAPKSSYEGQPDSISIDSEVNPLEKTHDELEEWMADIRTMAETGESIDEAMRTRKPVVSWDDILFLGGQLAHPPLLDEEIPDTTTVIGPAAKKPLVLATPVYISHMSFGALSKEAKESLARGSAMAKTAMCSGEGGIVEESLSNSFRYIFEYVPNRYSFTPENLSRVHAVEIKIGQSAKPGMGGHLPGHKVTAEIAKARGFPEGKDILSPSRFKEINSPVDLAGLIAELKDMSQGVPVGVKIAAGHIEDDIDFILAAGNADFITLDGRPGGTGSAPKYIKMATSVPTIYALHRARKHLDKQGVKNVSLVATGGFRIPSDIAKGLALGADAIAIATAALIAMGCRQFKMCNTGRCPYGITSQDPMLRKKIDIAESARRVGNFLNATTRDLQQFARITGKRSLASLSIADLSTTNRDIAEYTDISHV